MKIPFQKKNENIFKIIAIKVDFFITHSAATITTSLIGGDGYHDVTKFLTAHIDLWLP